MVICGDARPTHLDVQQDAILVLADGRLVARVDLQVVLLDLDGVAGVEVVPTQLRHVQP